MIGSGRSDLSRVERAAQARRQRARLHLERIQRRGGGTTSLRPSGRGRLALLLASTAAGLLFGDPLLRAAAELFSLPLAAIHVRGALQLSPDAVAEATGVAPGAALSSVDPQAVAARVAELPWIAEARAVRMPAGPLLVDVRERIPVALLEAGGETAFVDATGTAFAAAATDAGSELPRVRLDGKVALGEPDVRLAAALELAYRLPEHGLVVPLEVQVAGDGDPEGFSLRLPGLAGRVVLGREAPEARLRDLAELLAAEIPELASAPVVDLRFADRAVLGGGPSQGGAAQAASARGSAAASRPGPSG